MCRILKYPQVRLSLEGKTNCKQTTCKMDTSLLTVEKDYCLTTESNGIIVK